MSEGMKELSPAPQTAGERAGFGGGIAIEKADVAGLAAISREQSEIQAAMVIAKRFKRNESEAYTALITSCGRLTFANAAQYSFPRGGSTIKGPSINLAVEAARVWGNIRHGIRVVREDKDSIHIQGYAFDIERNTRAEFEDDFRKLIQRSTWVGGKKVTSWVTPDERDLRELVMRRGAILVRNAILRVLPVDVIEDAQTAADNTIKAGMSEGGTGDPQALRKTMIVAFSQIGVTTKMLADYLDHDVELIDPDEMVTLRTIYKSLTDGNSRRDEYFKMPGASDPEPVGSRTKALSEDLKKDKVRTKAKKTKAKKPEPEAEPELGEDPTQPPTDTQPGFDRPALVLRIKKGVLAMSEEERAPWMANVDLKSLDDLGLLNDTTLAQIEEALP